MATVEERVKKVVIEQLRVEEKDVAPSASFVDDLNADSLDLMELVVALEEEFSTNTNKKLEIPDADVKRLITVQDTINYIKELGIEDE